MIFPGRRSTGMLAYNSYAKLHAWWRRLRDKILMDELGNICIIWIDFHEAQGQLIAMSVSSSPSGGHVPVHFCSAFRRSDAPTGTSCTCWLDLTALIQGNKLQRCSFRHSGNGLSDLACYSCLPTVSQSRTPDRQHPVCQIPSRHPSFAFKHV